MEEEHICSRFFKFYGKLLIYKEMKLKKLLVVKKVKTNKPTNKKHQYIICQWSLNLLH